MNLDSATEVVGDTGGEIGLGRHDDNSGQRGVFSGRLLDPEERKGELIYGIFWREFCPGKTCV